MNIFKNIFLSLKTIKNINYFILDYFNLVKKPEIIYNLRNGLKFISRTRTTDSAEIIIINSDFEYPKKYYPKNKNPIILDIGANIGSFCIFVNKCLAEQNPQIYSLEPNKSNFEYLNKNIALNGFQSNIKTFCLGLYNKNGIGRIDLSQNSDSFHVTNTECSEYEEVEIIILEDFCSKNNIDFIDLLKIDIEGNEYEVFGRSIDFIKNKVINIFVEVHNLDENRNFQSFKKYIVGNGFKIVAEIAERTLFLENLNNIYLL